MYICDNFTEFSPKTLLFKTAGHDYCQEYGTYVREFHYYSTLLRKCINKNNFRHLYLAYLYVLFFLSTLLYTIFSYQKYFDLKCKWKMLSIAEIHFYAFTQFIQSNSLDLIIFCIFTVWLCLEVSY